MLCKNCKVELAKKDGYCQNCGARVLGNSITLKFVFQEILDKVLSVDNRLFKTFIHLIIKPHAVIESYIKGVRKRYYNPFSYLLISITLTGILALINKDIAIDAVNKSAETFGNTSKEYNEKIMALTLEYQSFFNIISIPIYALISWIVFLNKKKFNYLEHNIIYIYSSAQLSIINFFILGTLYLTSVNNYTNASFVLTIFFFLYNSYILIRLFNLSLIQYFIKVLLFLVLLVVVFVVFGILINIVMIVTMGFHNYKNMLTPVK